MGCCTHFRTTWWPGYSSDVIDPDKAFDCQRRLWVLKRVIIVAVVLALIGVGIYFLVMRLNRDTGTIDHRISTPQPLLGQFGNWVHNGNTETPGNFSEPGNVDIDMHWNFSEPEHLDMATNFSEPVNGNMSTFSELVRNKTEEQLCTPDENNLKCVALSKDFRTLVTFLKHDLPRNHSESVRGYILVKSRPPDSLWRPLCFQSWNLDMAYTFCHELGLKQLIQLQNVKLSELKQRVRKVGKDMSLEQAKPLEGGEKLNNDCIVGYISCI